MTEKTQTILKKNGQVAAAMIAAMIGVLSLGISHTISVFSKDAKLFIHEVGKLWVPGAEALGPYSGKESFMLIGWGLSWLILYFALRNRDVKLSYYTVIFMIGIGIATLLVWTQFVNIIAK
jgi:hypothetical protein